MLRALEKRTIFFISGNTAITAETMGMGLLSQFDQIHFDRITLPFVNTVEKAIKTVSQINKVSRATRKLPVVFSTLVDDEVRKLIQGSECEFIDFFAAFLGPLEKIIGKRSAHAVGRYHGLDDFDEYDSRVEAISYALGSDDGISTKKYDEADVILLGVSRTGKTPVCLYLAFHYGVHAANYPLTEENLEAIHGEAPPVLVPHRKKLCGLTINPARLEQIRARRRPGSRYASFDQCRTEVVRAEAIFASLQLPFFNVTSMSMEEIAVAVLETMHLPRR